MLNINVDVRRVENEYGDKKKFKMEIRYGLSGLKEKDCVALASPENLRPDIAYKACFFSRKCLWSMVNIGTVYYDYKERKYTSNYFDGISSRSIMIAGGTYNDEIALKSAIEGIKHGCTSLDVADDVNLEIIGFDEII